MIKVFVGNNVNRKAVLVDENSTLRKVLEDNNIDYSIGMTTLDGATLGAGELDKSFEEFGITEQCYLLNTAKAVNAAGIKVLGQTAVVISDFTREELQEIGKYRPDALVLVDEKTKEPVFGVSVSTGAGRINKVGATYGSGKDANGKVIITLDIPDGKDAKEYIEETVGVSILTLRKIEAGLSAKLAEIAAEKAEVLGTIEVM